MTIVSMPPCFLYDLYIIQTMEQGIIPECNKTLKDSTSCVLGTLNNTQASLPCFQAIYIYTYMINTFISTSFAINVFFIMSFRNVLFYGHFIYSMVHSIL
jgi:hypothetical protein